MYNYKVSDWDLEYIYTCSVFCMIKRFGKKIFLRVLKPAFAEEEKYTM